MTNDNNNHSNDFLFSEAPASWNTRYVDPNGFECQLTLRAETGQALLDKVSGAIAYLLKNECQSYSYRGNNRINNQATQKSNGKEQNGNPSWCSIHKCEMKRWEKDGKVWYSHKVNDEWCNGKSS